MGIYLRKDSPNWWYKYKVKGFGTIQGSTDVNKAVPNGKKLALLFAEDEKNNFIKGKRFDIATKIDFKEKFIPNYLSQCKSESGYMTKFYCLENFKRLIKRKYADEVTSDDILKYRNDRISEGMKKSTVNRELGPLRHAFNLAIKSRRLFKNPLTDIKPFSEKKFRRDRYLLPEEKPKLLPILLKTGDSKEMIFKIVVFAMQTGLRKGEIRNLLWTDINFDTGKIRVKAGDEDSTRFVPMTVEVKDILRSLERISIYVFSNEDGTKLKEHGFIKTSFEWAVKKSGIEDFHFHDLRHTFASDLAMKGVSMKVIGEYMGHSAERMTTRYSHLSPLYKAEQIMLLPSAFSYVSVTPGNATMVNT